MFVGVGRLCGVAVFSFLATETRTTTHSKTAIRPFLACGRHTLVIEVGALFSRPLVAVLWLKPKSMGSGRFE